jgi:hypothetical protein
MLFEELVFCILPIALAILIAPLRIYTLLRTGSKVEPSKRPIFKAVCARLEDPVIEWES